jgi:UDP-GlcNAc:undecaprenyl-phosphate/decaprenyl-phosphate GlcNAc-1-phosphate transferase
MTTTYLPVFLFAALTSFLLTRWVRNIAKSRGWVSPPPSARHIHKDPIPRLGGVAIFATFSLVAALLIGVPKVLGLSGVLSARTLACILGPATLVFLLGLYDDVRPLKSYVKFSVQAAAGALLFFGGFGVFQLPLFFGSEHFGWFALPLTILWVLWITNAFNLLDGVDGLAAGSALFSTLTVFVVSLVSGNFLVSSLTLALAGAILGFLRFNFNPATIFLGDCGSLFIGFMLSALALAGAQKAPTLVAVAIPVVSFGLPVLETVLSVVRRFLSGQPLFTADRGHIHHKLLERGFSQRQVVYILYAASAICGLLSLFLLNPSGPTLGIVLFVIFAGIWVGVQQLGYHEFGELTRMAHRTMEQKKIIVNNLAIRRATEALATSTDLKSVERTLREAFEGNDFDGFNLQLAHIDAPHTDDGKTNGFRVSWHKPNGSGGEQNSAAGWALTLDLKKIGGRQLGTFVLYRQCNGHPLMVDVNLLISGFNTALTEALDNALGQTSHLPAEEQSNATGLDSKNHHTTTAP